MDLGVNSVSAISIIKLNIIVNINNEHEKATICVITFSVDDIIFDNQGAMWAYLVLPPNP